MKKAKRPTKVTVELEFDDPIFLELYEGITKQRKTSLAKTLSRDLQGSISIYWGNNLGEFGKWFDPRFEKIYHLVGLNESEFCFDPEPSK